MAKESSPVFGGVDTHKDVHVAAVVDERGKILDTASFDANAKGYAALRHWLEGFGTLVRVGVEGTGSYGTGLTRHLQGHGVEVVEVNRPNRQMRRQRGKSDPVDAEAAARAALNGEAAVVPKDHADIVESIRVLRIAYCSARDSRTRLALQIRDLIVTAPATLRKSMSTRTADRVAHCAKFRPPDDRDPHEATRMALKALSRRYLEMSDEMSVEPPISCQRDWYVPANRSRASSRNRPMRPTRVPTSASGPPPPTRVLLGGLTSWWALPTHPCPELAETAPALEVARPHCVCRATEVCIEF